MTANLTARRAAALCVDMALAVIPGLLLVAAVWKLNEGVPADQQRLAVIVTAQVNALWALIVLTGLRVGCALLGRQTPGQRLTQITTVASRRAARTRLAAAELLRSTMIALLFVVGPIAVAAFILDAVATLADRSRRTLRQRLTATATVVRPKPASAAARDGAPT